jgi:hypothetical protein
MRVRIDYTWSLSVLFITVSMRSMRSMRGGLFPVIEGPCKRVRHGPAVRPQLPPGAADGSMRSMRSMRGGFICPPEADRMNKRYHSVSIFFSFPFLISNKSLFLFDQKIHVSYLHELTNFTQ